MDGYVVRQHKFQLLNCIHCTLWHPECFVGKSHKPHTNFVMTYPTRIQSIEIISTNIRKCTQQLTEPSVVHSHFVQTLPVFLKSKNLLMIYVIPKHSSCTNALLPCIFTFTYFIPIDVLSLIHPINIQNIVPTYSTRITTNKHRRYYFMG